MQYIPLTQNKFALIDDEDYELVSRFKWHLASGGYVETSANLGCIGGKQETAHMLLHRLLMRPPKGMQVDHRNHDVLDCRRANMRVCTPSQNNQNRAKIIGTSKFKGVCWEKQAGKWKSQIRTNGKLIFLGYFEDDRQAAKVYDAKAKELFGEFAYMNVPKE